MKQYDSAVLRIEREVIKGDSLDLMEDYSSYHNEGDA